MVRISLIMLVVLGLILSACGEATTTAAVPTVNSEANLIKIGLSVPLTGQSSFAGVSVKRGAQMAVDDFNKAGGLNGRKVTLIERDDKGDGETGIKAMQELIEQEKVIAVFGTINAAVSTVLAPIANTLKVPYLIPSSTATGLTSAMPGYVFRNSMVDSEQTPYAIEFAAQRYKKIALIGDSTTYGQLGLDQLKTAMTAKNIKPVTIETFDVNNTVDSVKPMVQRLKDSNADVIICWGLGVGPGNVRQAQKQLSYAAPLLGSWGLSLPTYPQTAGELASGTVLPQTFIVDSPNPKHQAFVARFKKEFNTDDVEFPSGLAQSYDMMSMLLIALQKPKAADDREALRTALENFGEYDGLIKRYTNPWKNAPREALSRNDFQMAVWQGENGKFKLITFK